MKKETLRAVTMLVSIIALAFVTAIMSNAQSRGQRLRVDIPFEFVVGDKTLAAGAYSVDEIMTQADGGISIRSLTGGHSVIRLTNAVLASAPRQKTSVTFLRYGNAYFLSQVWVSGSAEGRQVVKSKAERSAGRELARISSSNSLAQNSRPEVLTITATLE